MEVTGAARRPIIPGLWRLGGQSGTGVCQMLAALRDKRGRIAVPGFCDRVQKLTRYEREQMKRLPFRRAISPAARGAGVVRRRATRTTNCAVPGPRWRSMAHQWVSGGRQ